VPTTSIQNRKKQNASNFKLTASSGFFVYINFEITAFPSKSLAILPVQDAKPYKRHTSQQEIY
jgi:hypothetical protein